MTDSSQIFDLTRLPRNRAVAVRLEPDAAIRAKLARDLDLIALNKLRLTGTLVAEGAADWRLEAELGATVVQTCVVTLDPVTTRLDRPVLRRYMRDLPQSDPTEDDYEMPEDDSMERLPDRLDMTAVMAEALALNLPLYPRKPDAELGDAVFAAPGVAPMRDEDAKPLAGLAALKARMDQTPPSED